MSKKESIGGYLSLELSNLNTLYHDNAYALNTGRNALEHILRCKNYKHVYIPFFTCEVILEPFIKTKTPYSFYHINNCFQPILGQIKSYDAILYTNYFGLMNDDIEKLSNRYSNLIIDNSQAFYDYPLRNNPTFYSPRKFFGISDGGFCYNAEEIPIEKYKIDFSYKRFLHLIKSIDTGKEDSYQEFLYN